MAMSRQPAGKQSNVKLLQSTMKFLHHTASSMAVFDDAVSLALAASWQRREAPPCYLQCFKFGSTLQRYYRQEALHRNVDKSKQKSTDS